MKEGGVTWSKKVSSSFVQYTHSKLHFDFTETKRALLRDGKVSLHHDSNLFDSYLTASALEIEEVGIHQDASPLNPFHGCKAATKTMNRFAKSRDKDK